MTAEQWADFNRGIFGEAAILPVGNRMETAIQTANQITVKDGVAVFDGRQVYIAYGENENIAIQSGTQGMQRRDIVVLEYKRNEESGVESVQFKVINGIPAASGAKDPSVQDMDIRTGVTVSQKPFCRVRLNGTAIEGVDALVQVKEFKPHAFAAPVNNLAGTNPDLALAAPQGRELKKQVDALNSALGTFAYWDNVSTGENGAKSLTMSKAMRAEHMYLVLVRCLNGSTDLYPPYGYLLCMRLNAWKATLIGEEHEVISKEISSGKLTLTFKNTQHTRLVIYEVM